MSDAPRIDQAELQQRLQQARARHDEFCQAGLALDLTRGKPASAQLDLSSQLDGILQGSYKAADGTDVRNYGGLKGLPEARELGSWLLDMPAERVLAGGNSSLTLMYLFVETALLFGLGNLPAWRESTRQPKVLCPVPGYDRHFTICEQLGIEMLTVPMLETGPDMDAVEAMVAADPDIRAIWCVPKYSNPTGCVYDQATVERLAALPGRTRPGFFVLWDNAYAVHDLTANPPQLSNLFQHALAAGTEDGVALFASTSKITFAGGGVAFMGASEAVLSGFEQRLGALMIGPDKINQLRHARLFPDREALMAHMGRHADLIGPRFAAVERALQAIEGEQLASWTRPQGGYFVSVDTRPGLAREVVRLAAEAGVKLTPAGATFPYGRDPDNCNIRLAPTFPSLEEVERAMEVFINCIRLASYDALLQQETRA